MRFPGTERKGSRNVRGEITVFLSLSFVLILSFLFGILEVSVIQTAKNKSRLETDRAIFSLFGEYQRELLEDYHIFAVEGTYGTGVYEEDNLIKRMHYYGSGGTEHEITAIQYLTDRDGQAFREQVLAYMEQKYGIGLIRKFTAMTEQWEMQETEAKQMHQKEEQAMKEYEEIQNAAPEQGGDVQKETDAPEKNLFSCMEGIEKQGILSVVLPADMELSGKKTEGLDHVSGRTLRTGRGEVPVRSGTDGLEERLLYNEYILQQFQNAAVQKEPVSGEEQMEKEKEEGQRSLSYEVEYILSGKESDKENLEAVLLKVFFIRLAFNYAWLCSDRVRSAEAKTAASVLATLLLVPEASEALAALLMIAWAAGESVTDVRALLSGKRVPLVKSSENWQISLTSLPFVLTQKDRYGGEDVEGGITYEYYLRAFLYVGNVRNITMRTLDRIEDNLVTEKGLGFFRADQCVTKIEMSNTAQIYGDITYRFPVYFGYD